jgi:uncharacterized lipoprotein YbaY
MTLTGHIIGGQVVLDAPISWPEGAVVRVELVQVSEKDSTPSPSPVLLSERLKNFLSHAPLDLPPDAAEDHDKYLYGDSER